MTSRTHSRDWSRLLAGIALVAPLAQVARAETYLNDVQVADILFQGVKLDTQTVELTPDQMKVIARNSGERVLSPNVRVWWGPAREAMIIDRVVGKHEFITYAVGINADGTVKGVEIMDYRETYGYEVRRPEWRRLFVGKGVKDPLRVDKDIPNISGATLSSSHVTNGVRRVLNTYEVIKQKT